MAQIRFHGAAREVTGSMHILEVDGKTILLDCGLFQGKRAEAEAKNRTFPIDPKTIDMVILSHAHMDHTGRLPLLVKQGFTGPIYATPATRDLCAIMLADSAHIQEEDAEYLNKKRARNGEGPVQPLYTHDDATECITMFHSIPYRKPFQVLPSLRGRYFDAGHMLGSTWMELTITEPGKAPIRLIFSGDLGRFGSPLLRDPTLLSEADYLICESTYGGRPSPAEVDLLEALAKTVNDTAQRGGKVIIPAFSVGRTQMVVYELARLMHAGRIPRMPVFIDSPLAINATEIYRMHPDCMDCDVVKFTREVGSILDAANCTLVETADESKALNNIKTPCVIISASGMCESGRILHHLKNNVTSPKNTVLIVGFQGVHTLGRRIVEKQPVIKIFNQKFELRAQVVELDGFSGHAHQDEILKIVTPAAKSCRQAFLVHGEPDQMEVLAPLMKQAGFRDVQMPAMGQTFPLGAA